MAVRAVIPSPVDDGALARAHVAGDPEAFASLYRRYFPDLVRFLERRGNDHARAEDIAQETLARAFRYLNGFDQTRPMWPWLRTIAVRIAGVEAQRRTSEVLVSDTVDGGAVADDPVEVLAARSVLVASLRTLPARQRDALVMRYVEDRQPSDIAAVLGLTRAAFEQLLWRARRSLAREYSRISSAVLVPVGIRLRRAAAWADARVGAAMPMVLASAGDVAVGAVVVVAAVAGVAHVQGAPAAPPTVVAAAGYAANSPAGGMSLAAQTQRMPVATRPGFGQEPPGDIVVERQEQVGPVAARSRARANTDPTRDGTVEEDETVINTPLGPVRVGGSHTNGSGPGLVCRATGVCGVTKP